jgi:transcriptional repressor NF-X1
MNGGEGGSRPVPETSGPHPVEGQPRRQPPPHQAQARANGIDHSLPHRPQKPESMHGPAAAMPAHTGPGGSGSATIGSSGENGRAASRDRGQRGRGRGRGNRPQAASALDAGAATFQPISTPSTPLHGSETEGPAEQTPRAQSEKGNARNTTRKPKPKPQVPSAASTSEPPKPRGPPQALNNSRSARRAAFDQGAKLTKSVSASSGSSGSGAVAQSAGGETKKENSKRTTSEADDLINRLTRGLGKRPYFECPICYNSITPSQQIWSCLPPDGPPPSPYAPGIDVIDPKIVSAHYQACYTPFHYTCVRDWARRNFEEDQTRLRNIDSSDEAVWRCPGCQKRRAESIPPYR